MRFLMIVKGDPRTEAGVLPTEEELSCMGDYNDQLIKAGVMLAGEGLHPTAKGARVTISGKKTKVVDGPFTEAKELVAGFWVLQVKSKEEAIEWAKRVPFKEHSVELRELSEPEAFPGGSAPLTPPKRKPGTTRFMILLKADENTESDRVPSEKLVAEMGALMQEASESGSLLAGDGLRASKYGARVFYSGDERTVRGGPFAETEELVAGYAILQLPSRADAVEFGRRMLQIHIDGTGIDSGEVEVRQVHEIEEFPVAPDEKPDGWRAKETAFRDRATH